MDLRNFYQSLNKLKFLSKYAGMRKEDIKLELIEILKRKTHLDPFQWIEMSLPVILDLDQLFALAVRISSMLCPIDPDWMVIKLMKFIGVERHRDVVHRWKVFILNNVENAGNYTELLIRPNQLIDILSQTGVSYVYEFGIGQVSKYYGLQATLRRVGGNFIKCIECTPFDRYRNNKILNIRMGYQNCPICKTRHYLKSTCIYDSSLVVPYTGYWKEKEDDSISSSV